MLIVKFSWNSVFFLLKIWALLRKAEIHKTEFYEIYLGEFRKAENLLGTVQKRIV